MANEFVTLARYFKIAEALSAEAHFKSHGIPCFLRDFEMVQNNPFEAVALGGIRLEVWTEDAEKGAKLLEELRAERAAELKRVEEVPAGHTVSELHCPQCGQFPVFKGPAPMLKYLLLPLIIPIFFFRNNYLCPNCSHT